MTILSEALLLFLVMDPFGNIPLFMTTLKQVEPSRRTRVIARELLIALVVLVIVLFAGQHILSALQISEPSLTISGGIILFLIAVRMIFPDPGRTLREEVEGEPFVFPLAIPYVAGPSAIATLLFIVNREPNRRPEWLLGLLVAWAITCAILMLSPRLGQLLGPRGLAAAERLMGLVLTTVAVQMLINGLQPLMGVSDG